MFHVISCFTVLHLCCCCCCCFEYHLIGQLVILSSCGSRLRSGHLGRGGVGRQAGTVPDVEAPAHVAAAERAWLDGNRWVYILYYFFSSFFRGLQHCSSFHMCFIPPQDLRLFLGSLITNSEHLVVRQKQGKTKGNLLRKAMSQNISKTKHLYWQSS